MIKFSAIVADGGISISSVTKKPKVSFEMVGGQTKAFEDLLAFRDRDKVAKLTLTGDKGTKIEISAGIWKMRTGMGGNLVVVFELEPGLAEVIGKLTRSCIALEMFEIKVEEDDRFDDFIRNKSRATTWTTKKRAIPN
jgi:hypothetical protein